MTEATTAARAVVVTTRVRPCRADGSSIGRPGVAGRASPVDQEATVSPAGSQATRSASRGSFENISTIGWSTPMRFCSRRDLELLVPQHERDDEAGLAGPGGAARAVQVGLVVLGRVVVDDDVDVVDVDAAGGDVGGDQHRELAGA